MQIVNQALGGVLELVPQKFGDSRGEFFETYNRSAFAEIGIDIEFVQDNQSLSRVKGTLRGLHLQVDPSAQGKLVRVVAGSIFDVAVDVRPGSDTYLQHASATLDAATGNQFYVPPGFAHGFCTLEPDTVVCYKVTAPYDYRADRSVRFDDPSIGIDWPTDAPVLSDKDKNAPLLADLNWEY